LFNQGSTFPLTNNGPRKEIPRRMIAHSAFQVSGENTQYAANITRTRVIIKRIPERYAVTSYGERIRIIAIMKPDRIRKSKRRRNVSLLRSCGLSPG